ncbi:MAG TPA: TonB family protein [Candidatus Acidoferrales bacterium]|nr:TonB family protein [Candidatus Acidoferrales bacterium]
MPESMPSPSETGPPPSTDSLIELSPHAQLPRLDLGIDWGTRGQEFRSSLASLFTGPRAPRDGQTVGSDALRVEWIEGRLPWRALGASSVWHVAVIALLILPIWGFLPHSTPTLAPVQIEVSWYGESKELPPISLPAPVAKPAAPPRQTEAASKPAEQNGADAFHPRQSILSVPIHVTHPRQTLIRPDAPNAPPKVVPQLPNIVEWNAPELARPKFQLSAVASAPKIEERKLQSVAAPEVPNNERNAGPMNVPAKPVVIARPQIPLSAMSQPTMRHQGASADAPAPDLGGGMANDSITRNVIALSSTPGPPAPVAAVPEGNLAARISMSPEGPKPGEPGAENRAPTSTAAGGGGRSATSVESAAGPAGSSSLPAAVSVAAVAGSRVSGGGGIAAGEGRSAKPNLTPKGSSGPAIGTQRGPIDTSKLAAGLPPEKILTGSEIYTMHVNLPNVTSASGSWILNFAELDEDEQPTYRRKERLADPVPVHVTDPKYPPELIKGHVHGEVVLYAIIRRNGSVDSIQIVRDLDPELDRNAIDALEKWTFEPARRAGVPVDVEAVIHVPFSYIDPRAYPTANQ